MRELPRVWGFISTSEFSRQDQKGGTQKICVGDVLQATDSGKMAKYAAIQGNILRERGTIELLQKSNVMWVGTKNTKRKRRDEGKGKKEDQSGTPAPANKKRKQLQRVNNPES